MEGVPRMPMLEIELKQNSFDYSALEWAGMPSEDVHEATQQQIVEGLKKHISEVYGDDPEKYKEAIDKFIEVQSAAYKAILTPDFDGCNTLKKYFGQLHYMQTRFPFTGDDAIKVTFAWQDAFTGILTVHESFTFEQTAILFNIGAVHSILGAMDNRTTEEGIRISCVHFQCAAGLFSYIAEHFDTTLSADISQSMLKLFINIMLAQGQECLLEKSMQDNRKHSIVSKISQQVVDYYMQCLQSIENRENEEALGGSAHKHWKRVVTFKIAYYSAVTKYFMGNNSQEQDKYGQAVGLFGAAVSQLNESSKLLKSIQKETRVKVEEAVKFTSDVLNGKYTSAVKDNEFVYHEKIPDKTNLPEIKGASLVKALPFEPANATITGPDIFTKLVPMEAHLAASSYSEEKAKLLREVCEKIEAKDEVLNQYKQSIELDPSKLIKPNEPSKLDQVLIEKCAMLSVDQSPIDQLKKAMEDLTDVYSELDGVLNDILAIVEDEELEDQKLKDKCEKDAFSSQEDVDGIKMELQVYKELYHKASQMNEDLHTACRIHIQNLKLVAGGMDTVREELNLVDIAELLSEDDKNVVELIRKLCDKVVEMEEQRKSLLGQLRQQMETDDVTSALVTKHGVDQEDLFKEELKKHDSLIDTINKNLSAQDNILDAVTEANARYTKIRKTVETEKERVEGKVNNLITSCDCYEDVMQKCNEGKKFFTEVLEKSQELLKRSKEFHEENMGKRNKIYAKWEEKEKAKRPPPRPSAPKPKLEEKKKPLTAPTSVPTSTTYLSPDILAKMMAEDGDDELLNDPEFLQFLQSQGELQSVGMAPAIPRVMPLSRPSLPPAASLASARLPSRPHTVPQPQGSYTGPTHGHVNYPAVPPASVVAPATHPGAPMSPGSTSQFQRQGMMQGPPVSYQQPHPPQAPSPAMALPPVERANTAPVPQGGYRQGFVRHPPQAVTPDMVPPAGMDPRMAQYSSSQMAYPKSQPTPPVSYVAGQPALGHTHPNQQYSPSNRQTSYSPQMQPSPSPAFSVSALAHPPQSTSPLMSNQFSGHMSPAHRQMVQTPQSLPSMAPSPQSMSMVPSPQSMSMAPSPQLMSMVLPPQSMSMVPQVQAVRPQVVHHNFYVPQPLQQQHQPQQQPVQVSQVAIVYSASPPPQQCSTSTFSQPAYMSSHAPMAQHGLPPQIQPGQQMMQGYRPPMSQQTLPQAHQPQYPQTIPNQPAPHSATPVSQYQGSQSYPQPALYSDQAQVGYGPQAAQNNAGYMSQYGQQQQPQQRHTRPHASTPQPNVMPGQGLTQRYQPHLPPVSNPNQQVSQTYQPQQSAYNPPNLQSYPPGVRSPAQIPPGPQAYNMRPSQQLQNQYPPTGMQPQVPNVAQGTRYAAPVPSHEPRPPTSQQPWRQQPGFQPPQQQSKFLPPGGGNFPAALQQQQASSNFQQQNMAAVPAQTMQGAGFTPQGTQYNQQSVRPASVGQQQAGQQSQQGYSQQTNVPQPQGQRFSTPPRPPQGQTLQPGASQSRGGPMQPQLSQASAQQPAPVQQPPNLTQQQRQAGMMQYFNTPGPSPSPNMASGQVPQRFTTAQELPNNIRKDQAKQGQGYVFRSQPHPGQYISPPSVENSPKHVPHQNTKQASASSADMAVQTPATGFMEPMGVLQPTPVNAPKNDEPAPKQPSSDLAGLVLTPTRNLSTSADELLSNMPEPTTAPTKDTSQIVLVPTKIDEDGDSMVVRPVEGLPYMDEADLMKLKSEACEFRAKVHNLLHKPESNGLCPLDREWKQLSEMQEKFSRPLSTAVARCSSYKNRFQDIVPFDQSRVVLRKSKDDYINASIIEGISPFCPRFIATQSPLPNTCPDFWMMVYEQQVTLIIMLVNRKDVPKKCPVYWPADRAVPQQHGPLTVSFTTSKTHGNLYIERTFTIKHQSQSLALSVTQLQYIAWPEHRLPSSATDLLSFMSVVQGYHGSQRNLQWPVLVHCESGVGRTGVFCAFLAGINEINAGMGIVDVVDIVDRMRKKRKYMVQEKAQLKFVYDVILYHAIDVLKQRKVVLEDEMKPVTLPQQTHLPNPATPGRPGQFNIFSDNAALSSIQATVAKMTIKPGAEKDHREGYPLPIAPSKSCSEVPTFGGPTTTSDPPVSDPRPYTSDQAVYLHQYDSQVAASTSLGGISDLVQGTMPTPTPVAADPTVGGVKPDILESCNSQLSEKNVAERDTALGSHNGFEPAAPDTNGVAETSVASNPSLIELMTPGGFTLDNPEDEARKARRVTKEDFFKPGSGLTSESDPTDPFSSLDPMWGHKK